ncbi:hypothetical protein CGI94_23935 [Vibrio parahaemolyticus]|uniref:hypothetical protein n=1 Tax=Vibrio parahaemolyticus TaxID=670 RepID=UPI00111DE8D7|nr:hypothetical protein [Vibrio parahaemolyticus]TOG75849.1 hypothetical protein CGI94_23935 [Vibrio parahaemolyticus]
MDDNLNTPFDIDKESFLKIQTKTDELINYWEGRLAYYRNMSSNRTAILQSVESYLEFIELSSKREQEFDHATLSDVDDLLKKGKLKRDELRCEIKHINEEQAIATAKVDFLKKDKSLLEQILSVEHGFMGTGAFYGGMYPSEP